MKRFNSQSVNSDKETSQQQKSNIMLWREKNPYGLGGRFSNREVILR